MRTLFATFLTLFLLYTLLVTAGCTNDETSVPEHARMSLPADSGEAAPPDIEYDKFGFTYDSARVSDYRVKRDESLYRILDKFDFTPNEIFSVTNKAREVIDVHSFKPGQSYRVYASADSSKGIDRLVWQPNPVEYVVFEWEDSLAIYRRHKEITTRWAVASAQITGSLYETMAATDLGPLMAFKLSEIYAWEIDFFRLREGDRFRMLYEKRYLDGEFYEEGDILAVAFTHRGETYNAYRFEGKADGTQVDGYFDGEGNSVQKALLKAPFTYNQRISSGFSRSRFHPVLKRRMPHYGVDYAAPYGTPVLSVGDGTVTEARYRGASGNMVKIRHNGTYRTAYLHLKSFGRGIRAGAMVEQGQVIGYVGKTGRVTGTHLDYRLYKNGRPVNPLTVDLPASRSVPGELKGEFVELVSAYRQRLDAIPESGDRRLTSR